MQREILVHSITHEYNYSKIGEPPLAETRYKITKMSTSHNKQVAVVTAKYSWQLQVAKQNKHTGKVYEKNQPQCHVTASEPVTWYISTLSDELPLNDSHVRV